MILRKVSNSTFFAHMLYYISIYHKVLWRSIRMKKQINCGLFLVLLWVCSGIESADLKRGNIEVYIDNVPSDRGEVVVHLYGKDQKLFGEQRRTLKGQIKNGKSHVAFKDVYFGEYAIFVFQDENLNGTLDHNLFRMPAEPIGFSNNFKPTIFTGRPNFSDIKVEFNKNLTIIINVK